MPFLASERFAATSFTVWNGFFAKWCKLKNVYGILEKWCKTKSVRCQWTTDANRYMIIRSKIGAKALLGQRINFQCAKHRTQKWCRRRGFSACDFENMCWKWINTPVIGVFIQTLGSPSASTQTSWRGGSGGIRTHETLRSTWFRERRLRGKRDISSYIFISAHVKMPVKTRKWYIFIYCYVTSYSMLGRRFQQFHTSGSRGYNDWSVNCFVVLCNAMEVKGHPIFAFVWYDPL